MRVCRNMHPICTFPSICLFVCLMVLNATFNNISAISWRSVLLVEETGRPGQNHRTVASHWQTLFTLMLYTSLWSGFELTASAVITTDCIGSCKSNYQAITATTTPFNLKSSVQCITRYILGLCTGLITGTRIPDPPFSSFGSSRDYGMDLCSRTREL